MKRHVITLLLFTLTVVFVAAGSYADEPANVNIKVTPSTLNIQSLGTVVTVHTDIAYDEVYGSTVTLEGIANLLCKPDNRGNLVAKFSMNAVKDLVDEEDLILGTIELTLEGDSTSGLFSGSQEITVIDNVPTDK